MSRFNRKIKPPLEKRTPFVWTAVQGYDQSRLIADNNTEQIVLRKQTLQRRLFTKQPQVSAESIIGNYGTWEEAEIAFVAERAAMAASGWVGEY